MRDDQKHSTQRRKGKRKDAKDVDGLAASGIRYA